MAPKSKPVNFHLWSGSSPEDLVVFRQGVKAIKNWPIKVHYSKSSVRQAITAESEDRFFLAGTDKQRADSLVKLIRNKAVGEILCSRGGYGNLRILPLLDKMRITPAGKKRIWGYSDSTIIQHYLYSRFGWSWVHSPMLCSHSFIDPSRKEKIEMNRIFIHRNFESTKKLKIVHQGDLKRGSYEKVLIGGNLMSLVSTFGSKWEPAPKQPYFLFIEDIGEATYRLDRLLQMLSHSSMFKKCKGVILGHFTACPGYKEVLRLWAREENIFLASKLEMGHNSPNTPHPMGENIVLRVRNKDQATLQFPDFGI
ncbi:LD-carboxypeptidase [bacterium]|nr:LD-carboxypeptidase [bacterium]